MTAAPHSLVRPSMPAPAARRGVMSGRGTRSVILAKGTPGDWGHCGRDAWDVWCDVRTSVRASTIWLQRPLAFPHLCPGTHRTCARHGIASLFGPLGCKASDRGAPGPASTRTGRQETTMETAGFD